MSDELKHGPTANKNEIKLADRNLWLIRCASCLSLICVTLARAAAQDVPTAIELLDSIATSRDLELPPRAYESVLSKDSRFTNSKRPDFKSKIEQELRTDNDQCGLREWFTRILEDGKIGQKTGLSRFNLAGPERYVQYNESVEGEVNYVAYSESAYTPELAAEYSNAFRIEKFLFGDSEPVHEILRAGTGELSIGGTMEYVDGFPCYVLEGSNDHGAFKLWIDPEHGYHWRKANVKKSGADLMLGTAMNSNPDQQDNPDMAYPMTMVEEFELELSNVKIEEIEGIYFIVGAETHKKERHVTGEVVEIKEVLEVTDIDLHPDFESMNAFEPQIPNGTPVNHKDFAGIKFEWRDGKLATAIDDSTLKGIEALAIGEIEPTSPLAAPVSAAGIPSPSTEDSPTPTAPNVALYWLAGIAVALAAAIGGMQVIAKKRAKGGQ